jgi:7,8-dihydropterin-6-yl-methyl-4-(beta-D-ribofuranosyl)aminobenzene 5'-phosphate synthase
MSSIFNLLVCFITLLPGLGTSQENNLTIITIYDDYQYSANTVADGGFSCIIIFNGDTILFDAGARREEFIHNITALNISLKSIDKMVISHHHGDHTGNVFYVLKNNPNMEVYIPTSLEGAFESKVESLGANALVETQPVSIANGMYLSGEMGFQIKEQCLIIETSKGLVVIVGCSHPGIERMLRKITEQFKKPVYMVVGGFHTQDFTSSEIEAVIREFREMGVQKVSPAHCTGEESIQQLRLEYGTDFIQNGTGKRISL